MLTWQSIPSIYYGDEIGMRYLTGLPDHEGSRWSPGFNRAGCRTPMQWDPTQPNDGFSTAPTERLYLPQDPDPEHPTVATQRDDPSSTLNRVRRLIRLRRETPALRPTASTEVLAAEYPLVYLRGGSHLVVINPSSKTVTADIPALSDRAFTGLEVNGVKLKGSVVHAGPFGYAVFSTAG